MASTYPFRRNCWICDECGGANGVDDFNCGSDECRQAQRDKDAGSISFGILTLRPLSDGSFTITDAKGAIICTTPRNGRTEAETAMVARSVYDALCRR